MAAKHVGLDIALAILAVVAGSALAWALGGQPPIIGIDDAAIMRAYAENIANGAGYVYNVGGERVEGATSLLWTGLLTLAYLLSPEPEILIVLLAAGLTIVSVLAMLRLVRVLARRLGATPEIALVVALIGLVATPGYAL
ncbi:MAG: hypothetical protein AAFV49_08935 [Pseudomonadota bacterium]